jgi:hypothetical protein
MAAGQEFKTTRGMTINPLLRCLNNILNRFAGKFYCNGNIKDDDNITVFKLPEEF